MPSFQVQKVLNGGFEAWRVNTADGYSHPYEWGLDNGKGSVYVTREATIKHSGSYSLKFFNNGGSPVSYASHFIPVINDATHDYDLNLWYRITAYEAPVANTVSVREYNDSLTILATTPLITFDGEPLNAWTNFVGTMGGIGSGASLIFNAATIGIDFIITHQGTGVSTMYFDDLKLIGDSISLTAGFDWPVSSPVQIFQKTGRSASGESLSSAVYRAVRQQFQLNLSRMSKVDYDALYAFLSSPDVNLTEGTVIFTDDIADEYFGKFTMPENSFTAEHAHAVSGNLMFQELAY